LLFIYSFNELLIFMPSTAIYDSVFGTFKYSDAPLLMPIATILEGMSEVERRAARTIENKTKIAVSNFVEKNRYKSLAEIKSLTWDLSIADIVNGIWESSWDLGAKHAIAEMRQAIPKKLNAQQYAKYGLPDLISAIFNIKASSAFDRAKEVVKKLLSRNLAISGDYSKNILDRVKKDISQAVIVQSATGYPMPPKEVNARIASTLSVSHALASTIGRTETTTAYNESRVETFKQSSLATHCRFLGIGDDRQTDICKSRNGIVFPIADAHIYQPALHCNCRSTLSPLMPKINKQHQEMVNNPALNPNNKVLFPLPKGWR